MKKCKIYSLLVILTISIQNNSLGQELKLLKTTHFTHYPSASTIAIYNNRIYIMGDDAAYILITDTEHKLLDSIPMFSSKTKQISKEVKADIESSFLINKNKKNYLAALSSFSTKSRNKYISIELTKRNKTARIKAHKNLFFEGIHDINIEGATHMNKDLILSNRANLSSKINYLLLTRFRLRYGIRYKKIRIFPVTLPGLPGVAGISGLTYHTKNDMLLFTASTEKTSSSYEDGAIGDSFLGWFSNFSTKIAGTMIKADTVLSLTGLLGKHSLQKIESLAIESDTDEYMILHLVADNDNGQTAIFKIQMKK